MILKIYANDGWIFIGDIYYAEIRRNCQETESEGGKAVFLTSKKSEYCPHEVVRSDCNAQDFAVVSCFRKNNEPVSYAFNTKGYLMNDDGKTVESI